jgi:hypothetical protein
MRFAWIRIAVLALSTGYCVWNQQNQVLDTGLLSSGLHNHITVENHAAEHTVTFHRSIGDLGAPKSIAPVNPNVHLSQGVYCRACSTMRTNRAAVLTAELLFRENFGIFVPRLRHVRSLRFCILLACDCLF